MAHDPALDDARQRLALIQQMWRELQAARNDPDEYRGLAERIRRETDLLRQKGYPDKPDS